MLALLALFGQMLVSLLPMPAVASEMAAGVLDAASICHQPSASGTAPARPDKAPLHAGYDCPVCQAAHLLGSLVPPTAPPILLPHERGEATPLRATAVPPPLPAGSLHQPRAPPSA